MREKKYLDINTFEAGKERAKYLFSQYDDIVISFSGGKDSLVVLELMDMVRRELGVEKKLNVVFYDEELISDELAAFIEKIARSGRFNFRWICAPFVSEKFILGKKYRYLQWDITREFVRTPPDFAETYYEHEPVHESEAFGKLLRQDYGSVVVCLGLRAQESINRLKAVMRAQDCEKAFLANSKLGFIEAKPIYDWTQDDVFKFFLDNNIEYAPVYDAQAWGKANLRVATPFTNEGAKALDKLKEYDPKFYDRITQVFPEMLVQERYYKDYDKNKEFEKYGVTPMGILKYVEENLQGKDKRRALMQLNNIFKARAEDHAINRYPSRYPLWWVFYSIIIGTYKRFINIVPDKKVTPLMREHEDKYEEWKKVNKDYQYE